MLKLYNSLTRQIEPFKTTENMTAKMYSCGPSTYQAPHIGNYRTFLFEDILQRYLEYLGYRVQWLMTLTDVEDKAIAEAKRKNSSIEELTRENEAQLCRDFELLRVKAPSIMARASTAVAQSAKLMKILVEKGHAYWYTYKGRRNAYFVPKSYPGFGKLSHLNTGMWPKQRRRFHKDTYPGTPWNKGDFVIWHGCKDNELCYETEIGRGRPAWNIQDAAIVTQNLGFHVDIATGGTDNLVRHHDYTLAVSESVSGRAFADYWLHGAHLLVEGAKMSKSKGNVIYPHDLTMKGFTGEQIRFFLIYGHYRKRLNFTFAKLNVASGKLDAFQKMVVSLRKPKSSSSRNGAEKIVSGIVSGFEECMSNDLDVKGAFDSVFNNLIRLDKLRKNAELSVHDAKAALEGLERIDRVFRVIS